YQHEAKQKRQGKIFNGKQLYLITHDHAAVADAWPGTSGSTCGASHVWFGLNIAVSSSYHAFVKRWAGKYPCSIVGASGEGQARTYD
ncbi:hypothetical protein, partial [Serratia marcescens]|uniref:hypothetical protein n=1 Tax=Serratia marcescens TaxID=615 RepID=UPI001953579F